MSKFEVGDIVVGRYDSPYGVTTENVKCVVTKLLDFGDFGPASTDYIEVKILDRDHQNFADTFTVRGKYFDLVESADKDESKTLAVSNDASDINLFLTEEKLNEINDNLKDIKSLLQRFHDRFVTKTF